MRSGFRSRYLPAMTFVELLLGTEAVTSRRPITGLDRVLKSAVLTLWVKGEPVLQNFFFLTTRDFNHLRRLP